MNAYPIRSDKGPPSPSRSGIHFSHRRRDGVHLTSNQKKTLRKKLKKKYGA